METKLAFYLDEIFKTILVFFIGVVFFRAVGLNFTLSLLLASLSAIILCVLLYVLKVNRSDKKQLKANEFKKINELKEQISLGSLQEINNYFKTLFNANLNYKKELSIDDGKTIIKTCFDKEILEIDDIKKTYRENKTRKINKVIILCFSYKEDCLFLIKNFKNIEYEILNLNDVYTQYIKPTNLMPNFLIEKQPKEKLTFYKFKSVAFARNKSKTYFFCGLILLFSSYFVPLKIFYLIFSGLMFLSTLLCLILNKKKI